MAADEATGAGDDHKIILRHGEPFQGPGVLFLYVSTAYEVRPKLRRRAMGWAVD
jgi:hypothetical protein